MRRPATKAAVQQVEPRAADYAPPCRSCSARRLSVSTALHRARHSSRSDYGSTGQRGFVAQAREVGILDPVRETLQHLDALRRAPTRESALPGCKLRRQPSAPLLAPCGALLFVELGGTLAGNATGQHRAAGGVVSIAAARVFGQGGRSEKAKAKRRAAPW
jgi:hypothetical protein